MRVRPRTRPALRSPRGNALARTYFARAIGREPTFAASYACLGLSCYGGAVYYGEDAETCRAHGLAFTRTGFRVSHWAAAHTFKHKADLDHFVDGYMRAALPR